MIDAGSGSYIPHAQIVQGGARVDRQEAGLQTGLPQIFVLAIPGVADRTVAIANMELIGAGDYAFGYGVRTGKNEIEAGEIEALNRQREKPEQFAEEFCRKRKALQEGGVDDP